MPIASIRQVKAARALLGWSQAELATRSGISEPTIKRLEATDSHEPIGGRADTAAAIQAALEAAGVEFTNGGQPGVRMVKVDWRDTRQGDEPADGEKVIVQYRIGPHQTQPATFDADKREWRLDNGDTIPEREAGLWAPGPWPRT